MNALHSESSPPQNKLIECGLSFVKKLFSFLVESTRAYFFGLGLSVRFADLKIFPDSELRQANRRRG